MLTRRDINDLSDKQYLTSTLCKTMCMFPHAPCSRLPIITSLWVHVGRPWTRNGHTLTRADSHVRDLKSEADHEYILL